MSQMKNAPTSPRLRIGIWCAYHITLQPSEGIGVFAHNLARGLAEIEPSVEVVMVTKPGDEDLMQETVQAGQGRISVRSTNRLNWTRKLFWKFNKLKLKVVTAIERTANRKVAARPKVSLKHLLAGPEGRWPPVLYPLSFVYASSRYASLKIGRAGWKSVQRTAMQRATRIRKIVDSCQEHKGRQSEEIIQSCDVWLVPYVGLEQEFSKPTVVTIHDLVCLHFPDMYDAEWLAIFERLSKQVAARSTISACMSNFICSNDLRGVLRIPENKIRVVQPAAPADFGEPAKLDVVAENYPILREKYIFYPSAFRRYKNHELLIAALSELRQQDHHDLHLVFTGIHAPPKDLTDLIKDMRLETHVHVLGKVNRDVLALLYQQAVGTLVPSRYEQGSFPLMEALHWGCPIACSRIPSLVELFAPLKDAMLYFDTDDVTQVTHIIRTLLDQRTEILQRQQSYRQLILGRTWAEAAVDWRAVCEDAIKLHNNQPTSQTTTRAA